MSPTTHESLAASGPDERNLETENGHLAVPNSLTHLNPDRPAAPRRERIGGFDGRGRPYPVGLPSVAAEERVPAGKRPVAPGVEVTDLGRAASPADPQDDELSRGRDMAARDATPNPDRAAPVRTRRRDRQRDPSRHGQS